MVSKSTTPPKEKDAHSNTKKPLTTPKNAASSSDVSQTTITSKLADLNQQVEWFYGDDFSLDEATDRYKTALHLAKDIETDLTNLKNEITVLSKDFSQD